MSAINNARLERDSKHSLLLNALTRGCTVAEGEQLTGWNTAAVRSAFRQISKDTNRKLLHADDTYRLGGVLKAVRDADSKGGGYARRPH